jgi:hypothetical protein
MSFKLSRGKLVLGFFFFLSFYRCDKIPNINNLKGGRIYFGSWCPRFQFMPALVPLLWTWDKPDHQQRSHSGAKLLTSWWPGRQREKRMVRGQGIHFKDTLPVTYFFQAGATIQFLPPPNSAFNCESISALIHSLGHDLITSQKSHLWTLH